MNAFQIVPIARAVAFAGLIIPLVLTGCRKGSGEFSLPQDVCLLTGDLVLRSGTGADSRAITAADSGCPYSHIGMVVNIEGQPLVIHIVPDSSNAGSDTVRLDCIEDFFHPRRATHGLICRVGKVDSARRRALEETSLSLHGKGLAFDRSFNTLDHSAFYCTELIWYIYKEATGIDLTQSRRHTLPLLPPLIFCSDITGYNDKELIYKF